MFNNFDGSRSSPTLSIGASNAFTGSVSGSTYTIGVNFSSVASRGDAILNTSTYEVKTTNISSATIRSITLEDENNIPLKISDADSVTKQSLDIQDLPMSSGIGPQDPTITLYNLVVQDQNNSGAYQIIVATSVGADTTSTIRQDRIIVTAPSTTIPYGRIQLRMGNNLSDLQSLDMNAGTMTITGLNLQLGNYSPGVLHAITTSSMMVVALVDLSTEVKGILPWANQQDNGVVSLTTNVIGVLPTANFSAGATYYIQNGTALQASSTYNVSSATAVQLTASTVTIGDAQKATLTNMPLGIVGSVNNFMQGNIMNRSNGANASSDWVATNDVGNDSVGYINFGINGSGYSQASFSISSSSDSYLYASNRSLAIGTADSTNDAILKFFTGGTTADKQRMTIGNTGDVNITGSRFGIGGTTATWNMVGTNGWALITDGATPPTFRFSTMSATGGGTVAISSGPTFASTNTVTINNTTTETSIRGLGYGSSTFTANSLYVGETILVQATGLLSDAAITPGTLLIKIKLGGVVIATTTAFTPVQNQTNSVWNLQAYVTVRSIGATGSVIANSMFVINDTLGITEDVYPMINLGPTIIDTTKAINDIDITATWGTASGSNFLTTSNFIVDNFNGNSGTTTITVGGGATPTGVNYNVQVASAGALGAVSDFNAWPSSITITAHEVYTSTLAVNSSMTVTNIGAVTLSSVSWTNVGSTNTMIQDNGFNYTVFPSTGFFDLVDATMTVTTLSNATGYYFQMGASETWAFEIDLFMTGIAGGTEYGFNAPTGSTVTAVVFGDTAAVGTFSAASVTALNTADTVAFNTAAAAIMVRINGTMQCGLTPGAFQFMWKSVTGGNTSTRKAGSFMTAKMISR